VNLQLTTQHASAEATVAAHVNEMKDVKSQLESSTTEQSRLTQVNAQQQASIDSLQQQLTQLKSERETAESQLTDSKTLISQLQVSVIFLTVVVPA